MYLGTILSLSSLPTLDLYSDSSIFDPVYILYLFEISQMLQPTQLEMNFIFEVKLNPHRLDSITQYILE